MEREREPGGGPPPPAPSTVVGNPSHVSGYAVDPYGPYGAYGGRAAA